MYVQNPEFNTNFRQAYVEYLRRKQLQESIAQVRFQQNDSVSPLKKSFDYQKGNKTWSAEKENSDSKSIPRHQILYNCFWEKKYKQDATHECFKTLKEEREMEEATFVPKTNVSRGSSASKHYEKISTQSFFDRLANSSEKKKKNIQDLAAARDEKQMSECSFFPRSLTSSYSPIKYNQPDVKGMDSFVERQKRGSNKKIYQ